MEPPQIPKEKSIREQRIRKITQLYYSRPDVQKAIFEFSKNREISPRYFEGFGKRPDALQYPSDVFGFIKTGATSLHCSEELWDNPLNIETGMTEKQANELRIGWDLIIDIDCKWFDYSKLAAIAIVKVLKKFNVENIGIKFSGSKGFHIIIPWQAFPKSVGGIETKNQFPDLPRKIVSFIRFHSRNEIEKLLPEDFYEQFKNVKIKRGIKCNKCNEIVNQSIIKEFFCKSCGIGEERKINEIKKQKFKCPNCRKEFVEKKSTEFYECHICNINSKEKPNNFSQSTQEDLFELMGLDLVLVSPRHLFRMPYSLHEKTSLSSCVIDKNKISEFEFKDADPITTQVKNFMPTARENEASELFMQALDWSKQNQIDKGETEEKVTGKYADFKPIKLENLTDENFPPCIQNILKGIVDGRKRAVFILLNLFRSIGMEKEELEKKIYEWNEKNEVPLKKGYIISQLQWSYRRKPIMPQNCKEFYQGIGVCQPDNMCNTIKNPVNYVVKKNYFYNRDLKKRKKGEEKDKKKGKNNFHSD